MRAISWRFSSSGNGRHVAGRRCAARPRRGPPGSAGGRPRARPPSPRWCRRARAPRPGSARRGRPRAVAVVRGDVVEPLDGRSRRSGASTDETRSFRLARAVAGPERARAAEMPAMLEDLARPCGGAGRSTRRPAGSDSLSRSARMIGTQLDRLGARAHDDRDQDPWLDPRLQRRESEGGCRGCVCRNRLVIHSCIIGCWVSARVSPLNRAASATGRLPAAAQATSATWRPSTRPATSRRCARAARCRGLMEADDDGLYVVKFRGAGSGDARAGRRVDRRRRSPRSSASRSRGWRSSTSIRRSGSPSRTPRSRN